MWVAVYCRRSVDPSELGVSVHVQERNGKRYAAEHFSDLPVRAYVDNDLSAANPNVTRPAYQQFVTDVRAGLVAQVVAREQSRLTRQPAEWESLCTTLQLAGIGQVHQTHGGPVSVTEGSRLPGRIMAVVDAEYVEQVRVKVRGALAVNAEEGRPHSVPGYGYRRIIVDGRPANEPDPQTAPIAAQMVRDVAAGHSLGSIADRLNQSHTPTPRGGASWGRATVRAIVTAPRLIGQRVHNGSTAVAQWEPIVDRATWERAQARLAGNRPGFTADRRRKYLLSGGLAVCDRCDQPLISSTTPTPDGPAPSYRCQHPTRNELACGKCSILADRLEGYVCAAITVELADPGYTKALNDLLHRNSIDTAPIRAGLERVDSSLADLAVKWGSGAILEIEWAALRRTLIDRRNDLTSRLASAPVVDLTVDDVLDAWAAGGIARRPLIPVLCEPIRVAGAFRDGRRLTLDERVKVTFR